MTLSRLKHALLLAAIAAFTPLVLSPLVAAAQEITYYDFGASAPSASCSPTAPVPFCLNAGGTSTAPTFALDSYPPAIDPNSATDGNTGSNIDYYTAQLTTATSYQSNAMWYAVPQKVTGGFDVYFAFRITPPAGDGIAFVIQNAQGGNQSITVPFGGGTATCTEQGSGLTVVNGSNIQGGCLGFSGVDNSVALEFDTYPDTAWGDPDGNHIALQSCGLGSDNTAGLPNSPSHLNVPGVPNPQEASAVGCTVSLPNAPLAASWPNEPYALYSPSASFSDGNYHQVVMIYNGPNDTPANYLYVYLDPTFLAGTYTPDTTKSSPIFQGQFDITQFMTPFINSGTEANPSYDSAYVGFTAGNGGAAAAQEIMAWTYTPHTPVQQAQPVNPPSGTSPATTTFFFGTHNYSVTYPANTTVPSGTTMTVIATPISQAAFDLLVAGTSFPGAQCQGYDNTGTDAAGNDNCIVYNVSCSNAGAAVPCPPPPTPPPGEPAPSDCATNPTSPYCLTLNTAYDNSSSPITPGFLQGDPFFAPVSQIQTSGNSGTITCQGECGVYGPQPPNPGQTVTIVNPDGTPYNGTYTASQVTVTAVNSSAQFEYSSTTPIPTPASGTTQYLTSSNVQNIFTDYAPAPTDGSTTGTTTRFSDFIATAVTPAFIPTTTQLNAANNPAPENQSDLLTATISVPSVSLSLIPTTGAGSQAGGGVTFNIGSTAIHDCQNVPLTTTGASTYTATCSYTPTSTTALSLNAVYSGDSYYQTSTGPLTLQISSGTTTAASNATATYSSSSQPVTLSAAVTSLAGTVNSGTVTFSVFNGATQIGASTAAASVSNGLASAIYTLPGGTGAGSYTIVASYIGAGAFISSSDNSHSLTVSTASTTTATSNQTATSGTSSTSVPLSATVTSAAGTVNSGTVTFGVFNGATPIGAATAPASVSNGAASAIYTLPAGTSAGIYTIVASYSGAGGLAPSSDNTHTLTVSSSGPIATISPSNGLSFGTLYLGSIVTKTVTITNSGKSAMTITDPLIAIVPGVNGSLSEFVTINLCPKSLAAGKSCTMTVSFIAGPFYNPQSATLKIYDNAPGSPQTVPLTATVIDPLASFSATSLSFGTAKVGTSSTAKTITVTSAGGTPVSITKVALSDLTDYSESDTCTSKTLNPKSTCAITVTFHPKTKGSHPATLTVTDNALKSSQSISLSGTGD